MPFNSKEEWLQDFTEFSNIHGEAIQVPTGIFEKIKSRLFPNPWLVFSKVLVAHAVVGFLSLAICNQFGLNPFQTEQPLTEWFMHVGGHNFCMLACGVFFMASTYLLVNFFLKLEELETIKRFEWLQTAVIGLVSLGVFAFFGGEILASVGLIWLLGTIIGGLFSIEGIYRLRRSWT